MKLRWRKLSALWSSYCTTKVTKSNTTKTAIITIFRYLHARIHDSRPHIRKRPPLKTIIREHRFNATKKMRGPRFLIWSGFKRCGMLFLIEIPFLLASSMFVYPRPLEIPSRELKELLYSREYHSTLQRLVLGTPQHGHFALLRCFRRNKHDLSAGLPNLSIWPQFSRQLSAKRSHPSWRRRYCSTRINAWRVQANVVVLENTTRSWRALMRVDAIEDCHCWFENSVGHWPYP